MLPKNFHRLPLWQQIPTFVVKASLEDWAPILILVGGLTVLGLMGNLAYEDSLSQADLYQTMVCEGTWPDYKNLNPSCTER
jgi:hypothetical protein